MVYIRLSAGFVLIVLSVTVFSQGPEHPWERLGLSQTEWKMILDNKIPMPKVETLLKAGIGIAEYVDKPWIKFGMSEDTYIAKRRSGMTADDIEVQASASRGAWKQSIGSGVTSDVGAVSKNGNLLLSLVAPGVPQLKDSRYVTGALMLAALVGSIGWCIAGTAADSRDQFHFQYIPIVAILVPDIAWSVIDFKLHARILSPSAP